MYLVEGSIDSSTASGRNQFDSRVLSKIFGNAYPEVEFQSIGNSGQVKRVGEALQASQAIRSEIRQVIDRDGKSSDEIQRLESAGITVWRQRELENYLLGDEVLGKLCAQFEEDENRRTRALSAILASRDSVVVTGVSLDDYKARLNNVFREAMRQLPAMTKPGSTGHEFAISVLAPLITMDTQVFADMAAELKLAPRASYGAAASQSAGKEGEFTHKG